MNNGNNYLYWTSIIIIVVQYNTIIVQRQPFWALYEFLGNNNTISTFVITYIFIIHAVPRYIGSQNIKHSGLYFIQRNLFLWNNLNRVASEIQYLL